MLRTGAQPSTKFKDELRKYPWPRSSAIRAHLKRWIEHDETEAVWRKISQAADQLRPRDFIKFVVTARGLASGLVPTLNFHEEVRRRYIVAHEARIKQALKSSSSLSEIANVLEAAASDFRLHDRLLESMLSRLPANAVSRKDQNGSQAKRAFCLAIGDFLSEKSGKPMDAEVATLVDIALDLAEPTTIDQIRSMRRETTSRGRQARLN